MTMAHGKPILCLDFDGVIHSYTSGWDGADVVSDPPVPGAFALIEAAVHEFRVVIFSSRSNQPGGIKAMRTWLMEHGFPAWALERIEFPTAKPPAKVTIDDRALLFRGDWPSIEALKSFKPWNRQPAGAEGFESTADRLWKVQTERNRLLATLIGVMPIVEDRMQFLNGTGVKRSKWHRAMETARAAVKDLGDGN